MNHPPERFRIDLLAPASDTPAAIRLKRFLKCALRAFGLRCVGVAPLPDKSDPPPAPHPEAQADARTRA